MSVIGRIRAKVTRAQNNVIDFQRGLEAFVKRPPYEIAMKEDQQLGQRFYYLTKIDSVPDDLTAIAADVIQNLRSPLDHIAYQLVLNARGGAEPDWPVYYPITNKGSDYKAARAGRIRVARQEVLDAIDATEPYSDGKGRALWQLNELNKVDKHHLLIAAATLCSGIDFRDDLMRVPKSTRGADELIRSLPPITIMVKGTAPLKVGDTVFAEPLDMKPATSRTFFFEISLNAPGVIEPEPAMNTLQNMAKVVDETITRLGRLLSS